MNLNKVFLIGRLTQEVELKSLPSGTSVATLNLATNRVYRDKDSQPKEETQYHRVIVWGKLAETCKQYLSKGRTIMVEGRITYRSWLATDGTKRYSTEIVAENIQFGPKGGDGFSSNSESGSVEEIPEFEQEGSGSSEFEVPY